MRTPTDKLGLVQLNISLFIKRDDLYPSFMGGNKARKAILFFEDIQRLGSDCVVTYGSASSNHCRVVANMAASCGLPCYIITTSDENAGSYNRQMTDLFGARFVHCPVERVEQSINNLLEELKSKGQKPYHILGGGHGIIGTQAYVETYQEICEYEKEHKVHFDYVFHASGTGTTQAGLVCGQQLAGDDRHIIGISIARKNPYGRKVVLDSVKEYLANHLVELNESDIDKAVEFDDRYICGGYGAANEEVYGLIKQVLCKYGIPLDPVYTGKAFWGMIEHLRVNKISDVNVLFIHTGGTPLFYDNLHCLKGVKPV